MQILFTYGGTKTHCQTENWQKLTVDFTDSSSLVQHDVGGTVYHVEYFHLCAPLRDSKETLRNPIKQVTYWSCTGRPEHHGKSILSSVHQMRSNDVSRRHFWLIK
jgi:hypothetical protein